MPRQDKKINWNRTSDTTWESDGRRTLTYTATITKTANDHALVVNPGAVAVGVFGTLKNAKNAFRKFLHDK